MNGEEITSRAPVPSLGSPYKTLPFRMPPPELTGQGSDRLWVSATPHSRACYLEVGSEMSKAENYG